MPIYDMYPYSNLHELNLDFIIKLCEEFKDGVEGFEQEIADLGTQLEGEIDALEDRIEPFEQMFTLQTVGGETQIRANYRIYAGHGLTASRLKVNGALELEQPFTINLTGDVEGTATTNNLLNPLNIETTVVNGGGGGGETLPKVIFDGTIQGQLMGEFYIAQFPETLELVPECRYVVEFDGTMSENKVEYHQTYNGYGILTNYGAISFNAALLPDGNEHSLKITQVDNITKQLLYCATIPFTDNDDNYISMNDGYIPNIGSGDYTVVWDGITYNIQAYIPTINDNNLSPLGVYLGDPTINEGGADPEYPFFIDGFKIYTNSTEASHSIVIYGPRVDCEEIILYAEDNPTSAINPVYGDLYQFYSFESVTDLTQYIQNKTPVIIRTYAGQPTSGKYYPLSYSHDSEGVVIVINDGGTNFSYGIGALNS